MRGGDDRTDDGVGLERVADLQHVRHLGQPRDDRVVQQRWTIARVGAVQIWPEWNVHTEPIIDDRGLDVGVVEHERRALAAELEQQPLHRATADLGDAQRRRRSNR